jgi:hypothetical protein
VPISTRRLAHNMRRPDPFAAMMTVSRQERHGRRDNDSYSRQLTDVIVMTIPQADIPPNASRRASLAQE